MKYLSLFSGIGGFDIAFTEAGMECVGMCEIDKNAQEVLHRHWPDVPTEQHVTRHPQIPTHVQHVELPRHEPPWFQSTHLVRVPLPKQDASFNQLIQVIHANPIDPP